MRFGLEITNQDIKRTVQIAQAAEEAGFDTIWMPDHVPAAGWRDPFIAMTAIGQKTDHIKLGCGVTNPYSRHIGITGVIYASMAELIGERLILGIGAGGPQSLNALEIEIWNRPVTTIREAVRVLKDLFSGEKVDFKGDIVSLRNTHLFDKYAVPILIGTRGLSLSKVAGEIADGIILNPPMSVFPKYIDRVQEGLNESGRTRFEVVAYMPMSITESGSDRFIMSDVKFLISTMPNWVADRIDRDGTVTRIRRMLSLGSADTQYEIPKWLLREFAIVGDETACIQSIEALEPQIDEIVAPSPQRIDACLNMISDFKHRIIPSF